MKKSLIPTIFWILVGIFVVIVGAIVIPTPVFIRQILFPFMAIFSIIFFLLGIALVFLTLKQKVKGKLKRFLILTGASATGFFVGVILHNVFYAFGVLTSHLATLSRLMEIFHVAFFLIATLVCPIAFLIGAVGSARLFIKKRKKK
ncbi:MAG: hypothetical protein WBD86_01365 [Microgenomates group bacterium]